MAATKILLIGVLVACALVLSTNARSLSMKATKAEDEQKTFFHHPLPPFFGGIGGHGLGRPVFGLGPGLGFGPFGGIAGGSDLGGGGLGFGAGTGFESGNGLGFGSSIGGSGGGGGFGFGGNNGGTSPNDDGAFAGGQGEGGDDAALGNQKP
ncbi:hypothetical protein K7X08_033907 [Anisodus acutangulus]|uniref:Uncharacterized protein n=2 Tax=Anisodus TaxID=243963 RepID=A0A9Q1RAJ8_9SOLA|nr:hypothetical protein K7X08_033907 [Anisodus acutangulus]KAK4360422.1 hypothetical protein RND71_019374 [Anisodus tanguticus]